MSTLTPLSEPELLSSDARVFEAADRLREAMIQGVPCQPVRKLFDDTPSIETAYMIQQINHLRHTGAGRKQAGSKIGLTSIAVQKQLGVDEPDFGILYADTQIADGGTIAWKDVIQPKAEAEIAFVMGRDLTGDVSGIDQVLNAIEYATAAIEVVDSRILNWDIRLFDTIADNASSRFFVLGTTQRDPRTLDLSRLKMEMTRDGAEPGIVSTGLGADVMGNPLEALLWLARKMSQLGRPLLAGDIVLSGALGPMSIAAPGDTFTAHIEQLGSVRVSFGDRFN